MRLSLPLSLAVSPPSINDNKLEIDTKGGVFDSYIDNKVKQSESTVS